MIPIAFLSVTVSRRGRLAFAQRGPPDVVVCFRGDQDLATVAELSGITAQAITLGEGDLVVDLSRIEFMDASTVGVLSWARELLGVRSRSLVVRSPSTCARRVLELCDLSDLIDPRSADTAVTATAGALSTWVTVPAIDAIDRRAKASTFDGLPETVLAGPLGATNETSPEDVHRRSAEQPTRVAG
jgi:anti-anti-sigma factor